MSFAKSKTKRFNDLISCAPPPGHYDPKLMKTVHGAYISEKEKRFKDPVANENPDISVCSIASYGSLETLTPRKALFTCDSAKKPPLDMGRNRNPSSADLAKQREMEAEMKRLVVERNHLERKLQGKEDELVKLDGRLQQIQKDKTMLEATIATLRKELVHLRKSNDLLTHHLEDSKRPLLEQQEKHRAAMAKKESCLKDASNDLEQSRAEIQKLKEDKTQTEKKLQLEIENIAEETRQSLISEQEKLKAECAEEKSNILTVIISLEKEIQTKTVNQKAMEDDKTKLLKQMNDLKETILQMNKQKFEDDDLIRHLKGEVFAMKDSAQEKEVMVQSKQDNINKQEGQIEHLIQQEKQLHEDIDKLTTKCAKLEKDLVSMETVSKQGEEELLTDLSNLRISCGENQSNCDSLKLSNSELTSRLTTEQECRSHAENRVQGLVESQVNLSLQLQNTESQFTLLEQHNTELQNEIQSINWDKGMLEGRIAEMEEREVLMKDQHDDLQGQCEGRVKDVQGQILILRDVVDNKQDELNNMIQLRAQLQQQLQQNQNEFSIEMQKNRTREFLLQEQEKENCRELERAQRSEQEMKKRLEQLSRESISQGNELYEIKQQHQCLLDTHQHQIHDMRDKLRQSSLSAAESRQQLTLLERHMDEKNEALEEKDEKNKRVQLLLDEKLAEIEEISKVVPVELDHNEWKQKYELLYQKVLPFQEQLEAFETERCALLGINQNAQHEVEKLGREYAKLLGHQNQKQKIHHILKIKEENNSQKMEIVKLREQLVRQKRQITKLEDQTKPPEGRKKFNPANAFSHTKENKQPPQSPLREGNRR